MSPEMESTNANGLEARCQELYERSTWWLVLLSIAWLFLLSVVLPHQGEQSMVRFDHPGYQVSMWLLLATWAVFIADWLVLLCALRGDPAYWKHAAKGLLVCLAPAFRVCLPVFGRTGQIWIPLLGWQAKDRALRKRMVRAFSLPMIFIVLLVLPVLAIELFKKEWLEYTWVHRSLNICSQIIWFAFAVEFILIISVSRKKLEYCVRHWLDLAIILLPVILFILPFLSFLPIARLARLSRVVRSTRMLRLKGVGLKAFQTMVLVSGTRRFGRRYHEKRLIKLRKKLAELEEDMLDLHEEIAMLEEEQRELEENQD